MSTFLVVEIILVFLKSPYVNINDPKQLHLCIYYKCNIQYVAQFSYGSSFRTKRTLFDYFRRSFKSSSTEELQK